MATYIPTPPENAVPCGIGTLEVGATSEGQALAFAKIAAGQEVNQTIESAAIRALQDSEELVRRIVEFQQPRTLYTLGTPKKGRV